MIWCRRGSKSSDAAWRFSPGTTRKPIDCQYDAVGTKANQPPNLKAKNHLRQPRMTVAPFQETSSSPSSRYSGTKAF